MHDPKQTEMVAPKETKKTEMVKVYCLRSWKIERLKKDQQGNVVEDNSEMTKVGQIYEVTGKQAKELCKKLEGHYAFSGERFEKDGDCKKHDHTRARLATKRDTMPDEPLTQLED